MKKKSYSINSLKLKDYKTFIGTLTEFKEEFISISTLNTRKIIWRGISFFFADERYTQQELGLVSQIKSKLKNNVLLNSLGDNQYKLFQLRKDIAFNKFYRTTVKQMILKSYKNLIIFDINNAYATIALLLSLIDENIYNKLIEIKKNYLEKNKKFSLPALLGASFMGTKEINHYKAGKLAYSERIEPATECLWWLIAYFQDLLCRKICSRMWRYGEDYVSIGYYVDGLFFNISELPYELIKEDFDFSLKEETKNTTTSLSERLNIDFEQFYYSGRVPLSYKEKLALLEDASLDKKLLRFSIDNKQKNYQFRT